MIKTIIIDLDGTILDGRLRHYQCYSDILSERGFVPMPIDKYWEMKRNRTDRHKQLAVSGADNIYDEFLSSWLSRIEEKEYLQLDRLQTAAVEKISEWKASGTTLILITMRNNKNNLFWQLSLFELLPLFDRVVAVGNTEAAGDKAGAVMSYVDAADRGSILWIGDTETDINAARLIGVKVCAVYGGLRTPEYLAELKPDFIVSDLSQIELAQEIFQ